MLVYIMSPYTNGDHESNVRRQVEAAEALRQAGHLPFAPLLFHHWDAVYPHSWEFWMEMCLAWLRYAECAVRLPGASRGADAEEAEANRLGIPVYHGLDAFWEATS